MGIRKVNAPGLREIVGQGRAIGRLQRAMQQDRVPHAFLFAGPAGVGRRTTAEAFAKALLCPTPRRDEHPDTPGASPGDAGSGSPFLDACGRCDDCRMMEAGSHPDFQLVHKELAHYHDDPQVRARKMQELGIPVIRSFLIARAYRAPSRGRAKVFVVLESELMSNPAQNALLKTLEEPPAGVTIILICSKPERLLPTTLSRCATIRFDPLPAEFVRQRLEAEGVGSEEAQFWAAFTDGSVGRALRLGEQGMYEIKRDLVARVSGLTAEGDGKLSEHLTKVAEKLAAAAISAVRKDSGIELAASLASRRATGIMLELIAGVYRDALTLGTGADRPIANADQREDVERIAGRFDPLELVEILEALHRCEQLLWRNVNQKIVWDNVVITCTSAAPLGV